MTHHFSKSKFRSIPFPIPSISRSLEVTMKGVMSSTSGSLEEIYLLISAKNLTRREKLVSNIFMASSYLSSHKRKPKDVENGKSNSFFWKSSLASKIEYTGLPSSFFPGGICTSRTCTNTKSTLLLLCTDIVGAASIYCWCKSDLYTIL